MFNIFNKKENKVKARDIADIRRITITTLCPVVDDYCDWYAEHGITLPEEFSQDPTTWTNILRKIQRAFVLAEDSLNNVGEIHDAQKRDRDDLVTKLLSEQQEGFELFGKYLNVLVDPRYE